MIDRRQSMLRGSKDGGGSDLLWSGCTELEWNGRIAKRNTFYIDHLSSYGWRLVSWNDFASRAEIFVPSFAAMWCPTSLFFHASHCFCPLWRADQRRNIYILSFEGFNVFQNFGQARPAGCCHGIDGREMMDSVKLNDVSRHLFLVTRRSISHLRP